jgi:ribosomal protein S18 acetylase RimI-like enzyme
MTQATIRLLNTGDDALLVNAVDGVFDNPVNPELARAFLDDPRHHIVAAIDDDRVVGFVSAVDYIHPDKPIELWINETGVAPSHQKQGLAKAMLLQMLAHGRAMGCGTAWVLTDATNVAANALYLSVGGEAGADHDRNNQSTVGYSFDLENTPK